MNSAFQLTLHDYSAGIDVGFNAPVRSDGQTVSFRVDGAFYTAIYIKVLVAREFPFNHDRLADAGHFPAGSIWRFERFHECSLLGNCSESLILLQCIRLHGSKAGLRKGSLEAMPRAYGKKPCSHASSSVRNHAKSVTRVSRGIETQPRRIRDPARPEN